MMNGKSEVNSIMNSSDKGCKADMYQNDSTNVNIVI